MSKLEKLLSMDIWTVYKVGCAQCSVEWEANAVSELEAVKEFNDAGWRATSTDTLCPECAHKEVAKL